MNAFICIIDWVFIVDIFVKPCPNKLDSGDVKLVFL